MRICICIFMLYCSTAEIYLSFFQCYEGSVLSRVNYTSAALNIYKCPCSFSKSSYSVYVNLPRNFYFSTIHSVFNHCCRCCIIINHICTGCYISKSISFRSLLCCCYISCYCYFRLWQH